MTCLRQNDMPCRLNWWKYGRGSELLRPDTFTTTDRQAVEGLTEQQLVETCMALTGQKNPLRGYHVANRSRTRQSIAKP